MKAKIKTYKRLTENRKFYLRNPKLIRTAQVKDALSFYRDNTHYKGLSKLVNDMLLYAFDYGSAYISSDHDRGMGNIIQLNWYDEEEDFDDNWTIDEKQSPKTYGVPWEIIVDFFETMIEKK